MGGSADEHREDGQPSFQPSPLLFTSLHKSTNTLFAQPQDVVVLAVFPALFYDFCLSYINLWMEVVHNHKILWFSRVLRSSLELQNSLTTPYINLWIAVILNHKMLWFWSIFSVFLLTFSSVNQNLSLFSPSGSLHRCCGYEPPMPQHLCKNPDFCLSGAIVFRCNMVNKQNRPILHRYSGWRLRLPIYLVVTRTYVGTLWSLLFY